MFGCKFTPAVEKQYHSFPKDTTLRNTWVRKCRRSDGVNPNTARICSLHFSSSQLKNELKFKLLNIPPPKKYRNLLPTAVPDQNLPTSFSDATPADRPNGRSGTSRGELGFNLV